MDNTNTCRALDSYVDPPAPQPTIDLRRCKPGDRVRFANGDVGVYLKDDGDEDGLSHHVRGPDEWVWFFEHDGTWEDCRNPDVGNYVVEILGSAPTPNKSPTDETIKAEFLAELYRRSGRTCGTTSGLWEAFRAECLEAFAQGLAERAREHWAQDQEVLVLRDGGQDDC